MDRVLLVMSLLCVNLLVHGAPLLESVGTGAAGGTPVKSLPVIINADGLPLGISLSQARDIIALDGHVLISLPATSNDTLILKITAVEGYLHTFVSSRVVGEQLLAGSASDCVYQVTVIGDSNGQGFANLCDNLGVFLPFREGYVYTSKLGYSIIPAQGAVGHEVTIIPAALPMMMPPLTEANKTPEKTRRSVVKQRYIELLVVADHTTLEWHAGQDVESYILTLISLASRVLKDPSLGQPIELVMKKLVMLEQAHPNLKIVPNMVHTAKRFIRWKNKYEQETDESYDLALLLTRVDLKFGSGDHTGYTTTEGICQADKNYVLIEDGGLTSSYTIAHEIGHSLGLGHDGEGDNDCIDRPYIMSASAYASAQSPFWSNCSRSKLDELLRYEPYQCLHNEPATLSPDHKSSPLPGEKYTRDKQCQLRHGPSASSCDIKDQCSMLWCQLPGRSCISNTMSVADGTPCTMTDSGATGVCMNRQCSPAVNHTAVDGQWGKWSDWWSNCSRTCGVGVAYSERFCNSPKPSNGGNYCVGEQRRYRTCNVQDCPADYSDNYRDEQCKSHGDKWMAIDIQLSKNPCKVYCRAAGEKTVKVLPAADGTRCKEGSLDMCIAGHCMPVGCDRQLQSNATLDQCGVCNGDGSTCIEKSGTQILQHLGFNRIAVVPKGAFKVMVREKESVAANYIVAEDNHGTQFNGSNVSMTQGVTKVHFSGLDWEYGRPQNGPEYLMANGLSNEDVTVAVFAEEHCRGIEYSYLAPVDVAEPPMEEEYSWHYTFWSPCSVTCGEGMSTSVAKCFNSREDPVSSKYCKGLPKPKRQKRKCLLTKCSTTVNYDWRYTKWSRCSATCGGGVKTRTVQCMVVGKTVSIADKSLCSQIRRAPVSSKQCNKKPCPYSWTHSDWSNCSVECGMGHMSRVVKCSDALGNVVDDEKCTADIKPAAGKGCYGDGNHCRLSWQYMSWSECSVTCGMGIRTRKAECKYLNGTTAADSLCERHLGTPPPDGTEGCDTGRNCSVECKDSDTFKNFCPSIRDDNLCLEENLRKQCCKTCQEAGIV